jgi:hypothetical protein
MYRDRDVQRQRCTESEMYRDRDVQRQSCTETEMYRDRDVQRQRESGYIWMRKAGQGNDWTGVQRSAEECRGVQRSGMELTKFFFDGPSSSLMDQVLL